MGEFQRWNTHHSHVVPIEVCGTQLNIAQDPTSDNLGTTIWDASVILVRYMERNPQLYSRRRLEGKRVLELGAGCGLAGMYFALQGAHVTFTDLIEVVPLLQRNVTMNLGGQAVEDAAGTTTASDETRGRGKGGKSVAAAPPARPKAKVLEYDWGKPLDGLSPPYDYIVACDCVYVERLVESLVWSMARCSGRGTTVLVASEKREEVTYAKFRARLSEDFAVRQAPRRHMDKAYDHENSEVLVCKLRRTNSSSSSSANGRGSGGEDQHPGGERGKKQEIGANAAVAAAAITEEASKKESGDECCCSPGREAALGKAAVTGAGGHADDDALGGAEESIAVAGNAPAVTVPGAPPPSEATADVVEGLSLAAVSLVPQPLSSLETAAVGDRSRGPGGEASSTAVGGSSDPPLR
ncbi:conserved unknown protein [Ectocarpus siliculosus]|uniref:Uncharacterized protein n=1 Tax=Ectocarpus siliculosus TaxID=2880 RepID=D7FPY2_ECTSI|nr:conserved unknown protein [Ectocarpus siliculosus]|eukprot:CBJ48314.1 conserved unknown protein [Ectocarpus siliculosus]